MSPSAPPRPTRAGSILLFAPSARGSPKRRSGTHDRTLRCPLLPSGRAQNPSDRGHDRAVDLHHRRITAGPHDPLPSPGTADLGSGREMTR